MTAVRTVQQETSKLTLIVSQKQKKTEQTKAELALVPSQPIQPVTHLHITSMGEADEKMEAVQSSQISVQSSLKKASLSLMMEQLANIDEALTSNPSQLSKNLEELSNLDFVRLKTKLHGKWSDQITVLTHLASITKELLYRLDSEENPTDLPLEQLKEQIVGILSTIWGFVMTKTGKKRAENDELISKIGNVAVSVVTHPVSRILEPLNILLGENIVNPLNGTTMKKRPLQYFESREIVSELARSIRRAITERLHR